MALAPQGQAPRPSSFGAVYGGLRFALGCSGGSPEGWAWLCGATARVTQMASMAGRGRVKAAITARSAQSGLGRVTWRRRIATSCRRTRILS